MVERGLVIARRPADAYALTSRLAELERRLGDPTASIASYKRALGLAQSDVDICHAWIGVAAGVRLLGAYDDGIAALAEAEPIARAEGLDNALSQIHFYRGNLYFGAGKVDDCLAEQQRTLEHAEKADDALWQARALGGLGDAHYARGRIGTALDYFRRCIALCQEHGFGRVEVGNRFMVGVTRRYMNELEDAYSDVLAAIDMADKVGDRRALMYARNLEGEFLIDRGEPERAEKPLAKGLELADAIGNRRYKPYLMHHLARCLISVGRNSEAETLLAEAMAICRDSGVQFIAPRVLGATARAVKDAGARDAALDEGERILAGGCTAHNHLWFYREAIDACLAADDWDAVLRYAAGLEQFTAPEPLPWADFFIARGRALAAYGRGQRDETTMGEIRRLFDEAERIGLKIALPALEAALGA